MEEIRFSVKMKVIDMYRFLMYLSYSGRSCVINMVISVGALVLLLSGVADTTMSRVALGVIAALFLVVNPVFLYYRAAKQVKLNPAYEKPMEYLVNDEGILISQGEETMPVEWGCLTKIVERKHAVYVFANVSAAVFLLLPKSALAECEEPFKEALKKKTEGTACKCKWRKV